MNDFPDDNGAPIHQPTSLRRRFADVDGRRGTARDASPGTRFSSGIGLAGSRDAVRHPCIACAATAPSRRQQGHTVLALTHYSGGSEEGELLDPKECLERLIQAAEQAGADVNRLEIMLAGGEFAHSGNQAHRVAEHLAFLDDMNQGINVVLTRRGFVYSHAPLCRGNAES